MHDGVFCLSRVLIATRNVAILYSLLYSMLVNVTAGINVYVGYDFSIRVYKY